MGKKNKRSSSANVETSHGSSSSSDLDEVRRIMLRPSKSTMLKPCSESKANLKKRKNRDEEEEIVSREEFDELKESLKELSEDMIKLQELLLAKVELLEEKETPEKKEEETSERKEEETPKKKEEPKSICCFDCEDAFGNDDKTIFVKGFETSRPMEEIREELRNIFSPYGKVGRVFVPIECKTRLPVGFAFINLMEGEDKALELSGSYMGGRELEVAMATRDGEYDAYTNFEGLRLRF